MRPFSSLPFSSQLARSILAFASASSLGSAYAACSSTTGGGAVDASSSHASTSGAGGSVSTSSAGGAPTGGATSASSGFFFEAGFGEIGPPPNGPACIDWPEDAGACPTDPAVVTFILDEHGCMDGGVATQEASNVVAGPIDGGLLESGVPEGGDADAAPPGTIPCCYIVSYQYCVNGGRPYLSDGGSPVAPVVAGAAASASGYAVPSSADIHDLTPEQRRALAASWARDGQAEHASVASFARFALALLAHCAPADLVELAHRAAREEVRHARLCFGLASTYAGDLLAPGAFPVGDVRIPESLAALAVATVHEACVTETVSAVLAAEQLGRATDPAVRAALAEIVPDEARHTELGWRTVAWAIDRGGDEVRAAVESAFREALDVEPNAPDLPLDKLEAHGRLDPETSRAVARVAIDQVVVPAVRALLARPRGGKVAVAHGDRIEA